MTLWHLEIYVTICRCDGRLTRAAQELFIAQPRVSCVLHELEEHYHKQFFERIGKKLYITEDGKQFYEYASRILEMYQSMESSMLEETNRPEILRIGSCVTCAANLLPQYISRFEQAAPSVSCHVSVNNSQTVIQKVLANEFDLGLVIGEVSSPLLTSVHFLEDSFVFICSPAHPLAGRSVSFDDLVRDYPFALREQGSAPRNLFDARLQKSHAAVDLKWECISTRSILQAVRNSRCVSFLPRQMVLDELEAGHLHLIHVTDVDIRLPYHIIHHRDKRLTPGMEHFIQSVLQPDSPSPEAPSQ